VETEQRGIRAAKNLCPAAISNRFNHEETAQTQITQFFSSLLTVNDGRPVCVLTIAVEYSRP
jgi:hypothetical protein